MNKNYFLFIAFLSIAMLMNACGELKQSKGESTTFSTTTPLAKASYFNGVWVRQNDLERLENDPSVFCQAKKVNDKEDNIFSFEWLKVDSDGLLSFDESSRTSNKLLTDVARIDNEGHIKANKKLKAIEKSRFERELEKCINENQGLDKFYMSDKDFEQSFEMKDQTMIVNFVHTSYYCEENERIDFDEISATTYSYQKFSKQELAELIKDHKDTCE